MDNRVKNLMRYIESWVDPKHGGSTGELRLIKAYRDNQWVIELQVVSPTSTWIIGQ